MERLAIALTRYSIIAWRILFATMLARSDPDLPCTVVLNEGEWQALYCHIQRVPEPATTPPTLAQAVAWIGRLGGFLARKGDGPPETNVLWRGFQHLPYITDMLLIMRRNADATRALWVIIRSATGHQGRELFWPRNVYPPIPQALWA